MDTSKHELLKLYDLVDRLVLIVDEYKELRDLNILLEGEKVLQEIDKERQALNRKISKCLYKKDNTYEEA